MRGQFLVDTDWLHDNLDNPAIRIFDTTTILKPDPDGGAFVVESGKPAWDAGHIPGAGFLDLQGEFSDNDSRLRFTLPSADRFSAAAGAHGIGNRHHVVLYTTTNPMWATRMWWMFRLFGHERVSVLDGGFARWRKEERPISTEPPSHPETDYEARMDRSRVADKQTVLEAIDSDVCVINALGRDQHRGDVAPYGRPGRIKNSENLPWSELIDPETGCFLDDAQLERKIDETRAQHADRIITYCGGGIAASMALFAMALLGLEDRIALYDNSLSEWARDESLPMETGE